MLEQTPTQLLAVFRLPQR